MNKFILPVLILIFLFAVFDFALAQENKLEINFFYSRTCLHCAKENVFLDEIKEKYPEIKISRFEISRKENIELLKGFYQNYKVSENKQGQVPITFIDGIYFLGFNKDIENEIEDYILGKTKEENLSENSQKIKLPFIGERDAGAYSLPVLAVILGFLDGFNFCSLGALILILGLVLALKSRKKVLAFGGIFILTTSVVYGILIFIWYQVFSFFAPYAKIMEILIGLLGIGAGIYFFNQFLKSRKYGPTCEIEPGKNIMSKFSSKFQNYINSSKNIFLLAGIVFVFAAIITIVEFPCSAAIPVVFAGILSSANLSVFSYIFYIILFLVFYMLDELIVFLIAFFTMKIWLASSKSIIWITLAEAVILFGLGLYYLFGFAIFT